MTTPSDAPSVQNDSALSGWGLTALRHRLSKVSPTLSMFQSLVGLATGLISIGGVLFAVPSLFNSAPPQPSMGQILAIVEEAKTEKSITDAKIEILTPQNALITTVSPSYFGKARYSLEEGPYRVRVSHARYATEIRQVQVVKGQTTEVHLRLRAGSSSPLDHAERVVKEGVGAIRRIFRD